MILVKLESVCCPCIAREAPSVSARPGEVFIGELHRHYNWELQALWLHDSR